MPPQRQPSGCVIASALGLWSGGIWPLVAIIVLKTLIAVAAVAAAKESKDFDLDTIGKADSLRTPAHRGRN